MSFCFVENSSFRNEIHNVFEATFDNSREIFKTVLQTYNTMCCHGNVVSGEKACQRVKMKL